jgi:hypothetical protein
LESELEEYQREREGGCEVRRLGLDLDLDLDAAALWGGRRVRQEGEGEERKEKGRKLSGSCLMAHRG